MKFVKGHGTQNDFIVLIDLPAKLDLAAASVARLCDRRRGIGADGVLRVTTAGAALAANVIDRLPDGVGADEWFMDYRNADGSVAQMCGNGVRVFAHYVRASGLEHRDTFVVGSLAGPRSVVVDYADDVCAQVTVEMGVVTQHGWGTATVAHKQMTGRVVDVGNPHLACIDPELTAEQLAGLDIASPVEYDQEQFPQGVNVEVLTAPVGGEFSMRVHERGVGETLSCGTGTVAASAAALAHLGVQTGVLQVLIPGGQVKVDITDRSSFLCGPSVLVARGDIDDSWWGGRG